MTDLARNYTSKRMAIASSLVPILETINGIAPMRSEVAKVSDRLQFWDEVEEFPSVFVTPGDETREYLPGGVRERFLSITIRAYVRQDNALAALESLLEDIETVIEQNSRLAYTDSLGNTQYTQDIIVLRISTDEGVLEPTGIGEILLQVRY